MKKTPIAVQLWSVRDDVTNDTAGTLAALAKMGYEGVEIAGLGNHAPAAWAKMLADNGLAVVGAHVGLETVASDKINATMDAYATIGCTRLVVPSLPEAFTQSLDGYRRVCARLNLAAESAGARGMVVGYHNHDFEFKMLENKIPYFLMIDGLTQDVFLQFDLGWVYHAGLDGIALIRGCAGRVKTVHVKAYDPKNPTAVVGEDAVPWRDVLNACETVGGTEAFIVEHEQYANPPMVCVRQCLENLRKL